MKKIILLTPGLAVTMLLTAQSDSGAASVQFKLGAFYNSNLNYYGRTDSLRSSGFFPLAELWLKEKFFINAAPVFVHNKYTQFEYAGTVVTAGCRMESPDKKWLGTFSLVKPFYTPASQLVQSGVKAQGTASVTLTNKFLNVSAGGDIKFTDNIDFGLTAGLDHIFRAELPLHAVLVVEPSAYLFAGTQQFENSYLQKTGFFLLPGSEEVFSSKVKRFDILSYEFSLPVILARGKFQLLVTPALVVPRNLVAANGQDISQTGKNLIYVVAGGKFVL